MCGLNRYGSVGSSLGLCSFCFLSCSNALLNYKIKNKKVWPAWDSNVGRGVKSAGP